MTSTLILASASPRRQALLAQLGINAEVVAVDVEEIPAPHETPEQYVARVAGDKASAAAELVGSERLVLAADTEVVLDGRAFGKPKDFDDFAEMMRQLSGREHRVLSAVALLRKGHYWATLCESRVQFMPLSDWAIARYWQTGEPVGKAGGYAIQGYGARFIARLTGSYSGVMGLPLHETANLLEQADFPILLESTQA